MLTRVLLAVESTPLRRMLGALLDRSGIVLLSPRVTPTSWPRLARESADLLLVSHSRIPRPQQEAIRLLRSAPEPPDIVVFSDNREPGAQAELLSAGCEAVLPHRISASTLGELLESLLDRRRARLVRETREGSPRGAPRLSDFVSSSVSMQAFMEVVERIVGTDTSLLILGETGVGKERLARAIHAEGQRSRGPFVAVNCGALPEGLLESELFGHEEGAFTGATRSRRGHFELAHGGTLFLDEIGDLPLHLQVKLLRVLQDHEFQPIGSERALKVDVRVMAASNRDLEAAVADGVFRRDLFYRLGVVALSLPALRERREDIPPLAESYIEHFRAVIGGPVEGIRPDAMKALVAYDWPGNVRELMNVIERAVLLTGGSMIGREHLPAVIGRAVEAGGWAPGEHRNAGARALLPSGWEERPWREVRDEVVRELETAYLSGQLERARGRIAETARRSGMTTRSLHEKMTRLGLVKEEFRG